MATVGQVDEQDVFTCPVCLETLKSPKSLPCLHTFCETCIGEFILSTEKRSEQKLSNYPCPVCRTIVTPTNPEDETSQWAASLPQNFTISSLMDNSNSLKQECHICKRRDKVSEAKRWCRDCTEAFCEECLQMHSFMKMFADHKVVLIEEIDFVEEPDLSMISDLCTVHTSKVLEAFCFDHQELCCVICLTIQHRKCENVQAIEDMPNLHKHRIEKFESELKEMKGTIDQTTELKRRDREKLDKIFTKIEVEATTLASSVKEKVDTLLSSFLKELNLKHDEETLISDNKIASADKLSSFVQKMRISTMAVQQHGTLNQMFIFFENSKHELKSAVKAASSVLNAGPIYEGVFIKSEEVNKLVNFDCLGKIQFCVDVTVEMNEYEKRFYPSDSCVLLKTRSQGFFDSVILKHNKTIHLDGFDILAGVFVSEKIIVAGGSETNSGAKIKVIDVMSNDHIKAEHRLPKTVKKLAYDEQYKRLFLSCKGSKLFSLEFNPELRSLVSINKADSNNGGICVFEGVLYVLTGKEVQELDISSMPEGKIHTCFDANVDCFHPNGLAIDSKNKRFLYTSVDDEVVCTSLDGSEIFSFKDKDMTKVKCVAVHSNGAIFAGDKSGSVYAISEDGKQKRTVILECRKLKNIRDLCLNKSNTILAVCGPYYVELYDILY